MTEKRFKADKYFEIWDNDDFLLSFDQTVDLLNQLNDENEQLKKENKELRQDNDIKFWKLQCLQLLNNNQVMLFELSRVIQQGYEVSDKFKQYLDEIKEDNKEIREKHKRLFE